MLVAFLSVAWGDTYNEAPIHDTYLRDAYGPYGQDSELRINRGGGSTPMDVILWWDITSIMPGSGETCTINSATMYVYCYDGYDSSGLTADIHAITETWEEDTAVWPGPAFEGTSWATGDAGMPAGWKDFDITTLVQAWVNSDFDNYGLRCVASGSSYFQRWYSAEAGSDNPYLDVDYTIEASNIEETTWGVIKAGF
jgi:hypothetical protein